MRVGHAAALALVAWCGSRGRNQSDDDVVDDSGETRNGESST